MKLLNRLPAALLLLPPLLLCPALDPAIAQQVEAPAVRIDAQIQINLALCGTLSTDRTLTPAPEPYVLCRSGANVTGGATLTIESGVTVVAEPTAVLRVRSDGALRAVGSDAAPIRLVGADPTPGSWAGVWIESDSETNELAWVEIAYGGTSNYANLHLSQSARSRISNSTFRDAGTWGLHAAGASVSLPDFRSNRFHGNTIAPMRIFPQQMHWIDSETRFTGNGQDVIVVREGTVSGEGHVWGATSAPFLLTNFLNISANVEVRPGFQLLAADGASSIRVRTNGSIRAIGTAAERIRFTGEREEPGSWGGIWIESDRDNELTHVEIAHGGLRNWSNLQLSGNGRVVVTHSLFRDSSDWGIHVSSATATLPGFQANEFRGNALTPVRIFPGQMSSIDSVSNFAGNGRDFIEVRQGTLSGEPHVWRRTSVPFLLTNFINVSTRLDVEPGFRLLAADRAGNLRIRSDGSIRAIGTATQPIRFTAESEQPGAWSGLWIESEVGNELRFVEIAHGGRGSYHNIHLGSGAAVAVENSIIRDSASFGINLSSRTARLSETGNYFRDNASGDVRADREVLMLGGTAPFEPAGVADALAQIQIAGSQRGTAADMHGSSAVSAVSGQVINAVDRSPLEGVTVTDTMTGDSAITNRSGRYTLSIGSPGTAIQFSMSGFVSRTEPLDGRMVLDASLSPSTVVGPREPVSEERVVSGQVINATDRSPLEGVTVTDTMTAASAVTNRSGRYTLSIGSPGTALQFSMSGFVSRTEPLDSRTVLDVSLSPSTVAGR